MSFFSYNNNNAQAKARPLPAELSLASVMRQVYIWLALGLFIGFGIAFVAKLTAGPALDRAFVTGNISAVSGLWMFNPIVMIGSLVLYLILSLTLSFTIHRLNPGVAAAMYLALTAVFGVTITSVLMWYNWGAILAAFASTAGMFGAMAVIGYTTKTDLSRFGSILLMGLIGMLIASVVNIFLGSGLLGMIISFVGVVIFCGLTAYDTQWIKNNAGMVAQTGDPAMAQRVAIYGAFHLFLDFVNLFMYLLRIFGELQGRR